MIKTIIIDDETHCLDTLDIQLTKFCPQVEIKQRCNSAQEGLEAIARHAPQLVMLDIEMPTMNGFELLEMFKEIPFAVIFTTGYDKYAIKAIRFSALDYLLKPIDPKELIIAIQKIDNQRHPPTSEQVQMLVDKMRNREIIFMKIAVPTAEGFELIRANEIVTCEADNNYTYLYLTDGKKITACRTLKEVEEQLESFPAFVRVHHSYIVNLNEVTRYVRGEGGYLVMSNSTTVNVSRSRKEALLNYF